MWRHETQTSQLQLHDQESLIPTQKFNIPHINDSNTLTQDNMGLLSVTTATQLQLVNTSNDTVWKNIRNREKRFTEDVGRRGIGLTWGTIPAIVYTDENRRSYDNTSTAKIWNWDVQNTNQDSSSLNHGICWAIANNMKSNNENVRHPSQTPCHNFCFGYNCLCLKKIHHFHEEWFYAKFKCKACMNIFEEEAS